MIPDWRCTRGFRTHDPENMARSTAPQPLPLPQSQPQPQLAAPWQVLQVVHACPARLLACSPARLLAFITPLDLALPGSSPPPPPSPPLPLSLLPPHPTCHATSPRSSSNDTQRHEHAHAHHLCLALFSPTEPHHRSCDASSFHLCPSHVIFCSPACRTHHP